MADGAQPNDLRKWMAELIGSFFLTFAGVSALMAGGDLVVVALAYGGALALAVYAFGNISGAHVNPAISASLFVQRKISARDFVMYVIFQIIGATLAAFIAVSVFPQGNVNGAVGGATLGSMTRFPSSSLFNPGGALLLEIIMTFMLATAVATLVRAPDHLAPAAGLLIGGTLTVCVLFGGPWTGASLNPARSMGPALAYGGSAIWPSLWIYWVGPLIGGVLAGLVYKWLNGEKLTIAKVPEKAPETPPPA